MRTAPPVRYVRAQPDADIAYWTLGRGPVLVHTPNVQLSHVREEWNVPSLACWYRALARTRTLVRYDHRGDGLSSRGTPEFTIDALVRDIEAVVEATGAEQIALLGFLSGGLPAIAGSDGGAPDDAATTLVCEFLGVPSASSAAIPGLTMREAEILAQLATGASNAEIAQRLSISIHTVTRHLTHIYAKTGVTNRGEAIRLALEHAADP